MQNTHRSPQGVNCLNIYYTISKLIGSHQTNVRKKKSLNYTHIENLETGFDNFYIMIVSIVMEPQELK